MKKFTKVLVSVITMSTLAGTTVFAAPGSMDSIQTQKNAAEAEVNSLQADLTAMMTKLDELEGNMITKGEEIIKANADLEEAQKKEKRQYADMKKRIKVLYENGSTVLLTKVFESGTITEMLKQAENVQTLHEYDRKKLEEYVETKQKVVTLKESLEKDMENMKTLKADFASQKETLASMLEEKKAEVADLDQQLQKAAEEAARKAAEEAAKKAAEEAAKKAAEEKKKQEAAANKPSGSKPSGGESNSGGNSNTGGGSNTGGSSNVGSGDVSVGQAIVSAARSYIGTPYVSGGTSYSGIDCSGLTMRAHQAAGISIPRTSGSQAGGGKNVGSLSNALPGDIICYPGHVAIYIGGERVIHAPTEGQTVKEASVYMGPSQPITAIRRYW